MPRHISAKRGCGSPSEADRLGFYPKSVLGSFDVVVAGVGAQGTPARAVPVATVSDRTLSAAFSLVTVKPYSAVTLAANTHYYVGIRKTSGGNSHVILGNTISPKVLNRASVVAGRFYYNNGCVQANAGGPYDINVVTTP